MCGGILEDIPLSLATPGIKNPVECEQDDRMFVTGPGGSVVADGDFNPLRPGFIVQLGDHAFGAIEPRYVDVLGN